MDGSEKPALPLIAVIGGGPTGLTLANLLGAYGVAVLLVERNATTVQEPRAVSIDDESLRTLQAAGLIDSVLPDIVGGYGSRYVGPSGDSFLEVAPTEVLYGYPRRNAFRQPVLEATLRRGLGRFSHVQTLFGWRLEDLSQDGTGVELSLRKVDGDREVRVVRCAFVVGCDGAASTVRNLLGLTLDGRSFSEKWLIVDLENSPAPHRDTIVFCDPDRPCIALPGPQATRRFEFKLAAREQPEAILEEASVTRLLAQHGAAPESRIKRQTVYTFHARLAAKWSKGLAFLAGDACHLTPPFAGQGMNSGLRDAHNIAWKLAAVANGLLGPAILQTYETERRGHVASMIQLALQMGRIMAPRSRWSGAPIRSTFRALGVFPGGRNYFAQMKYKPKPRLGRGFVLSAGRQPWSSLVGHLLPQPLVQGSDGRERLLDEDLGDGFALVAFTDDPSSFRDATEGGPWARLKVKRLALVTGAPQATPGVEVAAARSAVLPKACDGLDDLVLLVRPDRYVAAGFRLADVRDAAARLTELCDSTWVDPPKP